MARAITKALIKSTIYVMVGEHLDSLTSVEFNTDNENVETVYYTDIISVDSKISNAKARVIVANTFGTNASITYVRQELIGKVSINSHLFFSESSMCEENVVYGHDTVTRDFKMTEINIVYIDDETKKPVFRSLCYIGYTTDSKLLKFARSLYKTCIIQSTHRYIEKRWMTKTHYNELCEQYGTVENENDTDANTDNN